MSGNALSIEAGNSHFEEVSPGTAEKVLSSGLVEASFSVDELDALLDDSLFNSGGREMAEICRYGIARGVLGSQPEGDFAQYSRKHFGIGPDDNPPISTLVSAARTYAELREKIDIALCEFPDRAEEYRFEYRLADKDRQGELADIVKRSEFIDDICSPRELRTVQSEMHVRAAVISRALPESRIQEDHVQSYSPETPTINHPVVRETDAVGRIISDYADKLNKHIDAAALGRPVEAPPKVVEADKKDVDQLTRFFIDNPYVETWINDTSEGNVVLAELNDPTVSDDAVFKSLKNAVNGQSYKRFVEEIKKEIDYEVPTEELSLGTSTVINNGSVETGGWTPRVNYDSKGNKLERLSVSWVEAGTDYLLQVSVAGRHLTSAAQDIAAGISKSGRSRAITLAVTAAISATAASLESTAPTKSKSIATLVEPSTTSPSFKMEQSAVQGLSEQKVNINAPKKLIPQDKKIGLIRQARHEVFALANQPGEGNEHIHSKSEDEASKGVVGAVDTFSMGLIGQLYGRHMTYDQLEQMQLHLSRAMYAVRYPELADSHLDAPQLSAGFESPLAHSLNRILLSHSHYSDKQKSIISGALAQAAAATNPEKGREVQAVHEFSLSAAKVFEKVNKPAAGLHDIDKHRSERKEFESPRIGYGISEKGRDNLRRAIADAARQTGVDPDFLASFYYAENYRLNDSTNNADSASGNPVTGNGEWRDPAPPYGNGPAWPAMNAFAAYGPWQIITATWDEHKLPGMNDTSDRLDLYKAALVAGRYLSSIGAGRYNTNEELFNIAFHYNQSDTYAQSVMNTYHFLKSFQTPHPHNISRHHATHHEGPYQTVSSESRSFWRHRGISNLAEAYKYNPDSYSETLAAGHEGAQAYAKMYPGFGPQDIIDCSGLVNEVLYNVYGVNLNENTTTMFVNHKDFVHVKFDELLPGDLIMPFFNDNGVPTHVEFVTGISGSHIYTFGAHGDAAGGFSQPNQVGPAEYDYNPDYVFLRYVGPDLKKPKEHKKPQTKRHSSQTFRGVLQVSGLHPVN